MKQTLMTLLLLLISSGDNISFNESYDELWAEVYAFENKSLPKSAYEIVEKIYEKARNENEEGQLLKAIIYKTKLSSQFEDNDSADMLLTFEKEIDALNSNSAKAVFHSMLGELYHNYGMANMYRFANRTATGSSDDADLKFESLEYVQKASLEHHLEAVRMAEDSDLELFEPIIRHLKYSEIQDPWQVNAKNLKEFILFRTLRHFSNSSSFVSLPDKTYRFDDERLMQADSLFTYVSLEQNTSDYKLNCLNLFQQAARDLTIDEETRLALSIKRLDYVLNHYQIADRDALYLATLDKIARDASAGYSNARALAYSKIINQHLQNGHSAKNSVEDQGHFSQAYTWIQKFAQAYKGADQEDRIKLFRENLKQEFLEVKIERVVSTEEKFLAYLNYRNINSVTLQLHKLQGADRIRFIESYRKDEKLAVLTQANLFKEWTVELPGADDFRYHGVEIPIEALDHGLYVLTSQSKDVVSANIAAAKNMNAFLVSDLSYITKSPSVRSGGMVLDRMEGTPIGDVKVEKFSFEYDHRTRRNKWSLIDQTETNSEGKYEFRKSNSGNFSYVFSKGTDTLDLRVQHFINNKQGSFKQASLNIFTDRSIYRPGQLVQFKGLAYLHSDESDIPELIRDKSLTVFLRDVNGQVVDKRELKTNDFGTFSSFFNIPSSGLRGNYQIVCSSGDINGRASISVEEYKRPGIKAEFEEVTEAYRAGDTITIQGFLESYSGVLLSGAEVKYTITKSIYGYPEPYYRRIIPRNRNELIAEGSSATNANGEFQISFKSEELDGRGWTVYDITCDITDLSGESLTISKSLRVGKESFYETISAADAGIKGEFDSIHVRTFNCDNVAYKTVLNLEVYSLKHETKHFKEKYWDYVDQQIIDEASYAKDFRFEKPFSLVNQKEYEIISKVGDYKLEGSVMSSDVLNELDRGLYKLVFRLENERGEKKEIERIVSISDFKQRAIPGEAIIMSAIKSQYKPGEYLNLKLNTPFKKFDCQYELVRKGEAFAQGLVNQRNKELNFKIEESHRGGFYLNILLIKHNRVYTQTHYINVPHSNKHLDIKLANFRDKTLVGSDQEWQINISKKEGAAVGEIELMASMYDMSLDQLRPHNWPLSFYMQNNYNRSWMVPGFEMAWPLIFGNRQLAYPNTSQVLSPILEWHGMYLNVRVDHWDYRNVQGGPEIMMKNAMPMETRSEIPTPPVIEEVPEEEAEPDNIEENSQDLTRENFNETLFFYPQVEGDGKGNFKLGFKMNDALTKWKIMLLAHSQEMDYAYESFEVQSYKPVMIEGFLPRFARQDDSLRITARVSNTMNDALAALTDIQILNKKSKEDITSKILTSSNKMELKLAGGESKVIEWSLAIPEDLTDALEFILRCQTPGFSDAEKHLLPVLSKKVFITESLPLFANKKQTKTFDLSGLMREHIDAKDIKRLSLVYNTDAQFLILRSLPFLMDSDAKATTGIFDALYASYLGESLLSSNDDMQELVRYWSTVDPESTLEEKADLKLLELNETPWLRDAQFEREQMQKLILLLDENKFKYEVDQLARSLRERMTPNGGFSWMPGGIDNWYITQYILEGISRMKMLGLNHKLILDQNDLSRALRYLDERFVDYYEDNFGRLENVSPLIVHYLYVRSLLSDYNAEAKVQQYMMDYLEVYQNKWVESNSYLQSMLGMVFLMNNYTNEAKSIMASLNQRMIQDEEMGYYWNDQAGYYWYELSIEKQATIIAFYRMMQADDSLIDGMRLWLLKHKQTNSWPSGKATASAIYAFFNNALDVPDDPQVKISIPSIGFEMENEGEQLIQTDLLNYMQGQNPEEIVIANTGNTTGWGALHYQYFTDIEDVSSYNSAPVKIVKSIVNTTRNCEAGQQCYEIGDRLRVKIEIAVDRPMEFVVLKDMRASGTDVVETRSRYKWQDGLGYYQSMGDLASHFYIDYLPKGNFVFEYDLVVSHAGSFQYGIAELQSVYAPEFNSHSKSELMEVDL